MSLHYVTLFDGVCDQTKELQKLYGLMSNNDTWIISSSGRYMFVKFIVENSLTRPTYPTGFFAKLHYGKEKN